MYRFTLPRDLYHGKDALSSLKNLSGKKAVVVVGGGSMKRFGFLDKAVDYLKEAGMEVKLIEGVEPDPSVETVMKGAAVMREFEPDWIVAMGGGSPIDAARLCGYSMSIPTQLLRKSLLRSVSRHFVQRLNSALSRQHRVLQQKLRLSQLSQTMQRVSNIRLLTLISHLMLLLLTLHLPKQCRLNLPLTQVWTL